MFAVGEVVAVAGMLLLVPGPTPNLGPGLSDRGCSGVPRLTGVTAPDGMGDFCDSSKVGG